MQGGRQTKMKIGLGGRVRERQSEIVWEIK